MKRVIILLMLIVLVVTGYSQPSSGTYTPINQGYNWLRGYFRAVHLPAGGATPSFASGQWAGDGAIWIDSVNSIFYFYSDGSWRSLASGGPGSVTSVSGLSPLFTTANPTTTPTFSLSNAAAYTVFGRASGSGIPSYISGLDSNWIPSLHSEDYYNTKYSLLGHTHLFVDITDGTTAVRNLLSQGSGISYNPATGVISATGAGLPLTDGNFYVGNASNLAVERLPTGDVTFSNTGVFTIGALKVATGMIQNNAVTFAKFVQGGANTVVTNPTAGTADFTTTALSANELLGRGSTGNIAPITVAGILSFSGTVLSATEVDGSTSNELQTFSNTSAATTHTVTLSNSGGSVQLAEGSGITLTTTGTGLDGILTIATNVIGLTDGDKGDITVAASGATWTIDPNAVTFDKFVQGAANTVVTNPTSGVANFTTTALGASNLLGRGSTGDIAPITVSGILSFSGTVLSAVEIDGSVSNELQTLANTSDATTHTATLSNSGGSIQFVEGGIITLATTGTGLNGILTISATEVDGSTSNELQTIAVTGTTTGITTLSNGGGSMTITGAGINTVGVAGSTITITGTEVDASVSNELQTLASTSDATTHTVTLSNSGGSIQYVEGTGITLTTSGTGLNGIVTIATNVIGLTDGDKGDITVSASGATWTIDNSAVTAAKMFDLAGLSVLGRSANTSGVMAAITGTADQVLRVSGTTLGFGTVANAGLTNSAITINGTSVSLGGTRTLTLASADFVNQGTTTTVLHGNAAGNPSWGAVSLTTDVSGDLPFSSFVQGGANTVVTNPTTGTADFTTTALSASNLLGRGSTGNIAAITVSGILSFSGTVLSATEVDGSTSNELQTFSNTSAATTHTVTLSNSGGSIQFVEGSGITLTTTGTALDGIVTIASTAGYTDEQAQDAIGAMINASLQYVDGTPLLAIGDRDFGDITTTGSGLTMTIDAAAITYAKIQNVAALSVFGRSANSAGVGADISASAASGAVLRESGSTIGWGTIATAGITNNAVTFAKFVQGAANTVVTNPTTGTADFTTTALSASNLLGRGSTGNIAAITVGGILSFSGTVLSATEVDGSTSNELQTLASTSNATTHTVTLSNSGGSFQLVEGSNITLTTTGTGLDGIITIASTGSGVTSLSAIGAAPNANAATITGSVLNLEPASASFGGVVTTGTQTFAGVKIFNNGIVLGNLSSDPSGQNGLAYYNSTTNRSKIYSNSTWQNILLSSETEGLSYNSSNRLQLGGTSTHGNNKMLTDAYIYTWDGAAYKTLMINTEPNANNGGVITNFKRDGLVLGGAGNTLWHTQAEHIWPLKVGSFTGSNGAIQGSTNNELNVAWFRSNGHGANGIDTTVFIEQAHESVNNATGTALVVKNSSAQTSGTFQQDLIGIRVSALRGTYGGTMRFYALKTDTGRVQFNDSVMIGTSSPTALFHSVGTMSFNIGSDATGDVFYRNSGGFFTRLGIGNAADVLTVSGGVPVWSAPGGGSSHAMLSATHTDAAIGTVARGDLITGQTATPAWTRLAKGTVNQLFQSDGTDIGWVSMSGDATLAAGVITIGNNIVTYAKMQDVTATSRIMGRITGGAGDMEELTGTQATTLLDLFSTTATTKGLVTGSNNLGATYYLDGSGTWSIPAGGYSNLTQFVAQTNWQVFHSNGSGDVVELALGANDTYLKSNGASSAPTWVTPLNLYNGDGTLTGNRVVTTGANTLALQGSSVGLFSIQTTAANGAALFDVNASTTNTSISIMDIQRHTSGTAGIGIGARVTFVSENSSGTQLNIGYIEYAMTNVTPSSETSEFNVWTKAAAGLNKRMTVAQDGSVDFFAYGSGTFTGTPVYTLQVDASGNIIEGGLGSGYTNLTQFVAQTNWQVFYSNGSGDVVELALGGAGTYLQSNGASSAPTWATPGGGGDMVLASAQTNSGAKTFLNATMLLRNVANTFNGSFTNTNTAARTYTLQDASGTLAFTSDLHNAVTLAGENYLSLATQVITANAINLSGTHVTGTLAAARFGALTGDVTNTVGTYATTIAADIVTYAKMQNVSVTSRIMGRITAGAGDMEELTGTQATTLLDLFSTTTTTKGLVPGSNNVGATFFLRADGTWAVPAGGGDMVLASAQTNSGAKTFLDGTMLLRNVANTFNGVFTNTNTAARTYTLKDANGTIAFVSDINNSLSALTAATNGNTISNVGHVQTWNWTADLGGMVLGNSATGSTTSLHTVLKINRTGSISNAVVVRGFAVDMTSTGGAAQNVGADFAASGGATNFSLRAFQGDVQFGGGGDVKLKWLGSSTGTITIQTLAAAGTYTLTLPDNDGNASDFLQTNGSGALSWAAGGGSGLGDPGANGVVVRTALNTTINRTLTGTSNRIVITNGDGVSANPTFDIGTDVVTLTGTQTLTNKRVTKRAPAITQSATPAINTDVTDVAHITGLAQAITSMTSSLTGTPVEGDVLRIDITDNGTARAITWGTSYEASTVPLPTTTVLSTRLDMIFVWNTVTSKWRIVGAQ